MNNFSLIQRFRNKIKIKDKNVSLDINPKSKIVGCNILIKGDRNSLEIGENVVLRGTKLEIVGDGCLLKIEKNCMIGDGCYLSIKEGKKLIIKEDSGLSRNIKILTSDGHPIFKDNKRINLAKDIIIGKHVWIADHATLLKGAQIGDGSVVGIESLITKKIPNNVIVVGNNKIIQSGIEWKDLL